MKLHICWVGADGPGGKEIQELGVRKAKKKKQTNSGAGSGTGQARRRQRWRWSKKVVDGLFVP